MAKNIGQSVENQFVKGLITEATGMNFPEQAAIETWNCRYNRKGNVTRRLGINLELPLGAAPSPTVFRKGMSSNFLWKGVANNGDTDFLVVQTGNLITFYSPDSSGNFTGQIKSFNIDLDDYKAAGAVGDTKNYHAGMASGNGKLFINHSICDPIYVTYDSTTNSISATKYEIQIRDFKGYQENLSDGERPGFLSNKHKYNLFNQGWYEEKRDTKAGFIFPLDYWITYKATYADDKYPSNADIWWVFKDFNNVFDLAVIGRTDFGNTPAPKGHFIDNAFYFDRANLSGISSLAVETSNGFRPSNVAFFAGRIWYAGVNESDYAGRIYYTQILDRDEQIGRCYQQNDPTAENLSDLLDTDGGVINITGLSKAIGLYATKNVLFVFSNNGIWMISGSGAEGTGFVATNFTVSKISSIGLEGTDSLVDAAGVPLWWNKDGIWSLRQDEVSYTPVNLTNETIRSFIENNIPEESRAHAHGAYNSVSNTIQWIYRSSIANDEVNASDHDRILELNLTTGAFYPMKWNASDFKIQGVFSTSQIAGVGSSSSSNVTNNSGVSITDNAGAIVTVSILSSSSVTQQRAFKYINLQPTVAPNGEEYDTNGIAFMEEKETSYKDAASLYAGTGKDYTSYFITGAKVHGQGDKTMNLEYITILANTSEGASAKVQARWDWANSGNTGKWSSSQEVYSSNRSSRDVSRKRLLMRGSGPALQLYFTSVSGKPFDIIGWVTMEGVNAIP